MQLWFSIRCYKEAIFRAFSVAGKAEDIIWGICWRQFRLAAPKLMGRHWIEFVPNFITKKPMALQRMISSHCNSGYQDIVLHPMCLP